MVSGIGDYAKHAAIWDWGGHDRAEEHERWLRWAKLYGKRVLIPFCAIGETAAYLALRGFEVTAFDITPEMIAEGKRRFGHLKGLRFFQADVTDFKLPVPPADFCIATDFGHILTIQKVRSALHCIGNHLRLGGVLVVETNLPPRESRFMPVKEFLPLTSVYADKTVYKTGSTSSDPKTGRTYISQTVHIKHKGGAEEQFDHSFYLQHYERDVWHSAFLACGFAVQHEYKTRDKEPWGPDDESYVVQVVKL